MFVIRPIEQNDLDQLLKLLKESGFGLTTLPRDPDVLKKRIRYSELSFAHREERPRGEDYLFVMEEIFTGKIVGVCGIISKIGGFEPYYFYQLKKEDFYSKQLSKKMTIKSLHFHPIHNGPAEICSLYLHPKYRNAQNGRFLSLSRFLFIADNRKYFEDEVIAEMRGRVNDQGRSPFWEAVGQHFVEIDFPKADYLTTVSKRFIEDLFPKYPIIVNLLPIQAQEIISEVHPNTVPAKRILEQEGFRQTDLVGLLEPGPVLKADLDQIRSIKESQVCNISEISEKNFKSEVFIISRITGKFRSTLGHVKKLKDGTVKIEDVTAAALKLRLGDKIRYVCFKPQVNKKTNSIKK